MLVINFTLVDDIQNLRTYLGYCLSTMISTRKSSFFLRCVPPVIQTRDGLPTMCLFVYFGSLGCLPLLKFFVVNNSNRSTAR